MSIQIRGSAFWAKVLGEPVKAYNPGEREWSIDVSKLDKTAKAVLASNGLTPKIKNDGDERQDYMTFRRREFKKGTETKNKPIRVIDPAGVDWPESKKIGNGSEVEVTFNTYQVPAYGKTPPGVGASILEVKVLKYIEFVPKPRVDATSPAKATDTEDYSK